jgi:hypothetical protein
VLRGGVDDALHGGVVTVYVLGNPVQGVAVVVCCDDRPHDLYRLKPVPVSIPSAIPKIELDLLKSFVNQGVAIVADVGRNEST